MIDWKAFYAGGGYSNENSDPDSYDDGQHKACDNCNGNGFLWYVGDEQVPKEIYDKVFELVPKVCECLKCETCDGTGEIEVEPYEPDPDYAYESKRDDYGI
jgi:RecJ-like exonuclease